MASYLPPLGPSFGPDPNQERAAYNAQNFANSGVDWSQFNDMGSGDVQYDQTTGQPVYYAGRGGGYSGGGMGGGGGPTMAGIMGYGANLMPGGGGAYSPGVIGGAGGFGGGGGGYNAALANSLAKAYQSAYSQAKQANLDRYNQVLGADTQLRNRDMTYAGQEMTNDQNVYNAAFGGPVLGPYGSQSASAQQPMQVGGPQQMPVGANQVMQPGGGQTAANGLGGTYPGIYQPGAQGSSAQASGSTPQQNAPGGLWGQYVNSQNSLINQDYTNAIQANQLRLASSGLSNSTVGQQMNYNANAQRAIALGQLAQNTIGLDENLTGLENQGLQNYANTDTANTNNITGFIERRTDPYPSLSDYTNVMMQLGRMGAFGGGYGSSGLSLMQSPRMAQSANGYPGYASAGEGDPWGGPGLNGGGGNQFNRYPGFAQSGQGAPFGRG